MRTCICGQDAAFTHVCGFPPTKPEPSAPLDWFEKDESPPTGKLINASPVFPSAPLDVGARRFEEAVKTIDVKLDADEVRASAERVAQGQWDSPPPVPPEPGSPPTDVDPKDVATKDLEVGGGLLPTENSTPALEPKKTGTIPASDVDRRLDEVRARLDGATRGPWHKGEQFGTGPKCMVVDGTGYHFGAIDDGQNLDFIAHAREDIPWLISLVDELRRR